MATDDRAPDDEAAYARMLQRMADLGLPPGAIEATERFETALRADDREEQHQAFLDGMEAVIDAHK